MKKILISSTVIIMSLTLTMTAGISYAAKTTPLRTIRLEKILQKMQQRRMALQTKKMPAIKSIKKIPVAPTPKIQPEKPTSSIPSSTPPTTPPPALPPPPTPASIVPATSQDTPSTQAPTPTSPSSTTPTPSTPPTTTSPSETPPPTLPSTPTVTLPTTPTTTTPPVTPPAATTTQLKNGLYVWNVTELLDAPDTWITKLQSADIGGGQKINEVYLSAYHGTYATLTTKYQTAITKLHAANMQVYLLVGNYDWAIPATWNWINTNYVPLAANFDGVMLDVEPWATSDSTTKTWWTSLQAPQDFANFINNWKTALGSKKLTLSIGNWHDTATPSQLDLLTKIYTSNADWITIMDYSTSSYISRIAYETTLSKPTAVAFDINKTVTPDPTIVFQNLTDLKNAVTATLQTYPTIRGFAINDQTLLD